MSGEGEGDRSWIPEELRTNPSLEKFKEPGAVVKSYVELEGRVGKMSVPKDDAAPEAWEAYYSTRRPTSPDDYGIKAPDGGDPEAAKWFAQKAHLRGLDKRQATGIFTDLTAEYLKGATEKFVGAVKEGRDGLAREWGADAIKRQGAAARAMSALGVKDPAEDMSPENLTRIYKAFAEMGMQMNGDTAPAGSASGQDSLAAVREEIAKIEASKEYRHMDFRIRQPFIEKMELLVRREMELEQASK